jgi:hypothetical protein
VDGKEVTHQSLRSAITQHRRATDQRLADFRAELRRALGRDADKLIGEHTCVYAVGSAGRGELTPQSDLDLFVVRHGKAPSNLDAVALQAAILNASRRAGFPDPSGDGEWLRLHTAERFVELLGSREDDSENTFTARMLLLLESRLIVGEAAYTQTIASVIAAYWRNVADHPRDYLPIILLNDIVRYWRIVLLNYEARNVRQQTHRESAATREAKRRVRSYKLRFSRCLTCYSGLAWLLAFTRGMARPHVRQDDVRQMVALSPLERLLWVRDRKADVEEVGQLVDRVLGSYLNFLTVVGEGKQALENGFRRKIFRLERSREGSEFGELMFELVSLLGQRNPLFRWLVV